MRLLAVLNLILVLGLLTVGTLILVKVFGAEAHNNFDLVGQWAIVGFTGLLVVVGVVQSCWMWRAVSDSKRALEATQRAFVFLNRFEIQISGGMVLVTPAWENSGTTPTRKMFNHVSWKVFNQEPPNDYMFPDLGVDGNPVGKADNTPFFLGARATSNGPTLEIPFEIVKAVSSKQIRAFIWGWTEYNDVFDNTPRHRTTFCNELKVRAVEVKDSQDQATISFVLYRRGNCADEECNRH